MSDLAVNFMSPAIICVMFVLFWSIRFPLQFVNALKFNDSPVHIGVISWAFVVTPIAFLLMLWGSK